MAVAAVKSPEPSTDLVVFENLTPIAIFAPGGVNDILEKIAREVRSTQTDISTKAGREAVASLAYKVARSKTALDKMGKELGETHYKSWKAITSERARIETELDALRDEVRKPLTDWENAEKKRIDDHEAAIAAIMRHTDICEVEASSHAIGARIDSLESMPPRDWQEFAKRAAEATAATQQKLALALSGATRRETERAELERFRAEQVASEQKERDNLIAAEAAERARAEAETKAKREAEEAAVKAEAERNRVEQERTEAIARAERAEADKKAAAAKAEQDAREAAEAAERNRLAAIETERKRVAEEAARVAAETAKREANKKHLAKINNEVLAAFVGKGIDAEVGKVLIAAIARGEIPHTKIAY
jgi:colicin import membrane protein